jgi:hypothetical protein
MATIGRSWTGRSAYFQVNSEHSTEVLAANRGHCNRWPWKVVVSLEHVKLNVLHRRNTPSKVGASEHFGRTMPYRSKEHGPSEKDNGVAHT